jgi:hypothetical protein
MKRNLYLASVLIFLLISQSCSTVNIASNKQQGYNKQPKKIYIVINCDKTTNVFCSGLVNRLKSKFTEKDIQSESYVKDPLSLESEEELTKKISSYSPEAVLMIQQTVTGGSRCTFELTLIDGETKKHVWKSELDVSADSYASLEDEGVINKGLKALLDKLIQDKII